MNGDTKEIVDALHELAKEVGILKTEHTNLKGYIYNDLKVDIEKLCGRVENCMNKSVDERQRDLKWMVAQIATLLIGAVGWFAFLAK